MSRDNRPPGDVGGDSVQSGNVFGNHGPIYIGTGSYASTAVAPDPPERRWSRRGTVVVGIATVLACVFAGITLWIQAANGGQAGSLGTIDRDAAQGAPGQSEPALGIAADGATGKTADAPPPAPPGPSSPPTVFSDVVDLAEQTGVDVDTGKAVTLYKQDAVADLFLGNIPTLYSSARHSDTYEDTGQGPESGAYARCAKYLRMGVTPKESLYVNSGYQFCVTTSDGKPGWVQVVSWKDDSTLLKVVVWRA